MTTHTEIDAESGKSQIHEAELVEIYIHRENAVSYLVEDELNLTVYSTVQFPDDRLKMNANPVGIFKMKISAGAVIDLINSKPSIEHTTVRNKVQDKWETDTYLGGFAGAYEVDMIAQKKGVWFAFHKKGETKDVEFTEFWEWSSVENLFNRYLQAQF